MVQIWDNLLYEIILQLLRGELHLRGISKKVGAPHTTVSRSLISLLDENVLDYRNVGKNKVFFLRKNLAARTYVYMAESYALIRLMKRYPELAVISEEIVKSCRERQVIVFGSYAKLQARKESDIDLYVETQNKTVKEDLEKIHTRLSVKIGEFDLNSPLIKEIIKNHVILKGVEEFYERTKLLE